MDMDGFNMVGAGLKPAPTEAHRRRSIRLRGYDYAKAGAYFVTICAQDRACLFGEVVDEEMRLNDAGRLARMVWEDLPNHYQGVELDAFMVMPNHVHGIVVLVDDPMVGAGLKPAPTDAARKRHGLPEIVRGFKTFSARRINEQRGTPGAPVWQRNDYEHIIRNDTSLNRVRRYIGDNPARWALDRDNPAATHPEPANAWQR